MILKDTRPILAASSVFVPPSYSHPPEFRPKLLLRRSSRAKEGTCSCIFGCPFSESWRGSYSSPRMLRPRTSTASFETLYFFSLNSSDGSGPEGPVVIGQGGFLYGTTYSGGIYPGWGTVFALSPPSEPGGAWTETQVYLFTGGSDGSAPYYLAGTTGGELYGLASAGLNNHPTGTAFSLTQAGDSWTERTIQQYLNYETPTSLYAISPGILVGTSFYGGNSPHCTQVYGCGAVFKLTSSGQEWTSTDLFSFPGGNHDGEPLNLVAGSDGTIYGPAEGPNEVCPYGCGSVFALRPPPAPGGSWTARSLHAFSNRNGDGTGGGGLVLGKDGVLYGTIGGGGGPLKVGLIFSLAPPRTQAGSWIETILHTFGGAGDGYYPTYSLVMDRNGVLYGTTIEGGDLSCMPNVGCGTVFSLSPPSGRGGSWTYKVLHAFEYFDGATPEGGVTLAPDGTLFGTTSIGGPGLGGTVFALKP